MKNKFFLRLIIICLFFSILQKIQKNELVMAQSIDTDAYILEPISEDSFEPDNTRADADNSNGVCISSVAEPQLRNHHIIGDNDWARFYAEANIPYEIKAAYTNENICNQDNLPNNRPNHLVIELFDSRGNFLDTTGTSSRKILECNVAIFEEKLFLSNGIYYAKIFQNNSQFYGSLTEYNFSIQPEGFEFNGCITGIIQNDQGEPIVGAAVKSNDPISNCPVASRESGAFTLRGLRAGRHIITVTAPGYTEYKHMEIDVPPLECFNISLPIILTLDNMFANSFE